MKAEIYKAATNGDVNILSATTTTVSTLRCLTSGNNNIIHVAAKHGQAEFISQVCSSVKELLDLIEQQNLQGDTPLHVAARHGHEAAAVQLVAMAGDDNKDYCSVMQNEEKDTPLHIALKYCNTNLAAQLLQSGAHHRQALSVLNRQDLTPLHLLIGCLPSGNVRSSSRLMSSSQAGATVPLGSQYPMSSEFLRLLEQFLSSHSDAACVRDKEGLTPLIKAANLRLFIVLKMILEYCPESAEVHDFKGRTLLHCVHFLQYEELKELLRIPEVRVLKNVRDCDGNTPAHLAIQNGDLLLVKVLYEFSANFSLKNNKEISVLEQIEHHSSSFCKMEEALFRSKGKWMKLQLYYAAIKTGDVGVFDKRGTVEQKKNGEQIVYDENYYLAKTPSGSTILHLAISKGHLAFVKEALERYPSLILSTDFNGDTVIHIIARLMTNDAEVMLRSCAECYRKLREKQINNTECCHDSLYGNSLWKVKNINGYNALHEAMHANNHRIASDLLSFEPSLLFLEANEDDETPIRVSDLYGTYIDDHKLEEEGKLNLDSELSTRPTLEKTKTLSKKHVQVLLSTRSQEMDLRLHMAAIDGDVGIFSQMRTESASYFCTRTPHGNNILHLALLPSSKVKDKSAFMEIALNNFPGLIISEKNCEGDTPVHLAAKEDSPASRKLLDYLKECCQKDDVEQDLDVLNIFCIKNLMGNRAIHEAVCANNVYATIALLDIDPEGALSVNDKGETPLHVYARCGPYSLSSDLYSELTGIMNALIPCNVSSMYMRDRGGFTPLLRAAKCERILVLLSILMIFPKAAQIRDSKGRTFLHLLCITILAGPVDKICKNIGTFLFGNHHSLLGSLLFVQDCDGNTPLHYALKTRNPIVATILANGFFMDSNKSFFFLVNNQNETVADLIESQEDTPKEIVQMLEEKNPELNTSWFRSSRKIRNEEIKEMTGSLSIIAGLLASVTFVAAFQVPGGYNQESGVPIYVGTQGFFIFIVADVVALVGSMISLFSLLWVMAADKIGHTLLLLDISLSLLQVSFYSTVVAFVTGVVLVLTDKVKWLSIFVLVLGILPMWIVAVNTPVPLLKKAGEVLKMVPNSIRSLPGRMWLYTKSVLVGGPKKSGLEGLLRNESNSNFTDLG